MDSGLQIDNVQSFAEITDDNDSLWRVILEIKLKDKQKYSDFITHEKFEQLFASIYSWLRRYKDYLYIFLAMILTIMALENCIGYSFDEINKLHNGKINRDKYKIGAGGLKTIYEEMLEHSYREQERQKYIHLEQQRKKQERLRLEAERKERERRLEKERQERARRQAEKQTLLNSLKNQFEQNFLNAHNFYQTHCSEHISLQEYQAEKSNYVRFWVQQHLNFTTNLEQAAAIGAVKGHIQVVARAGSGKTSTLVISPQNGYW